MKRDDLFALLHLGWTRMPDLQITTGWKAHTIRAAISTGAKGHGITIERKRENGITSYRVKPESGVTQ